METIFGVEITNLNKDVLKNKVQSDINNNRKKSIIALNPEKIMKARQDPLLKEILGRANYKIVDGIGIIYASKLKHKKITTRLTGIDCLHMLCSLANESKYKVFLYGGSKEVVNETKLNLQLKYPQINIVGAVDGYIEDNDYIVSLINEVNPNILFVALGSPKQEYWINNNFSQLNVNIIQGVGGSFDVISNHVKRAPKILREMGLEWLYRLIKEPKRIKRQLPLFKFLFLIMFKKG